MTTDLLLIHGAWQGSWAWDALIPHLTKSGWTCHAVDLPENGRTLGIASMDSYVAHCAAAMPRPVIVIAHSGAGVIASQLAETWPDRVLCIVYLTGMMLPSGIGFAEVAAQVPNAQGIGPFLEWSPDRQFSAVPVPAALEIFLHDCPPQAAKEAAARLTPQRETGRALRATLTDARFGRMPRIYIEATQDRSVVPAVQRRMQTLLPGARILSIDAGHVPQLAKPGLLAIMLNATLDRFRSSA